VLGATAPSTKAWIASLPKPSMTFSRARRGVPPATATAPATSILKGFFEKDEGLAGVGGAQYLAELAASVVTVINTEDYG
jgi:hypothetical protein